MNIRSSNRDPSAHYPPAASRKRIKRDDADVPRLDIQIARMILNAEAFLDYVAFVIVCQITITRTRTRRCSTRGIKDVLSSGNELSLAGEEEEKKNQLIRASDPTQLREPCFRFSSTRKRRTLDASNDERTALKGDATLRFRSR